MEQRTLGVMIDCSRNAVMNVPSLKKFIDYLSKMGYNMLQLYTEDTYEIEGEPYFGYLRGRYTKEELNEVDAYAKEHGIEMIPCIQTLAHLNCITRWGGVYGGYTDIGDILLAEDERTYTLIATSVIRVIITDIETDPTSIDNLFLLFTANQG